MDPRRKGYNPDLAAKRVASQSPEGGAPQKRAARRPGENSPAQPSSRRSSVSSGTSKPARTVAAATDSRRISAHPLAGPGGVQSPDSVSSRYEDAQSGSSTPLNTIGPIMPQSTGPIAPTAPMPNAPAGATAPDSLFDMLMNFSNQTVQMSMAQMATQQSSAKLNRATEEYNNMKGHFDAFPAIKEQRTTAKALAENQHKVIEEQLNTQMRNHKSLVEGIAAALGKSTEVNPASRAVNERTELSTSRGMEAKIDEMDRKIANLSTSLGQSRRAQSEVDKVQARLDRTEDDIEALRRSQRPPAMGLQSFGRNDMQEIQQKLNDLSRKAEESQKSEQRTHDKLDRLDELKADFDSVTGEIKDLKDAIARAVQSSQFEVMVGDMKAITERLGKAETDMDSFNTQLEQSNAAIIDHVGEKLNQVNDGLTKYDATRAADSDSLWRSINQFKVDFHNIRHEIAAAEDSNSQMTSLSESHRKMTIDVEELKESSHALKTKADKDFVVSSLQALDEKLKSLQEKMTHSHTVGEGVRRHSRASPFATTSAQADQYGPNGLQATLQNSSGKSSPLVNQSPRLRNDPPPDILSSVNNLRDQVQNCLSKGDAHAKMLQVLQMRFDNLTTDDMVHQMLGQFSEHWPHAANYEATVHQLQDLIASLQHRAETVEQMSAESKKTAENASSLAHGAAGDLERMKKETFSKLKGNATESGAFPEISAAERQAFQERLATIESKLAKIQENLNAAETNGKTHGADNEVPEKDIRELRKRIDDLESEVQVNAPRIENHDSLLREGQKRLSKAQGDITALLMEAGKVKGRLKELEEEYLR
ncbi:hypothetical protein KC340_g5669 [Hortaea werneckii]|nr:hypothetical protein KC342_g7035 [Hortaea werneckii]KAI7101464.1 hypothetical protein KC339_g6721 [Hortaea werneckii]KAI7235922.1 hypothetical protein KC365_g5389 [Hortaea werneckii]KAI7327226.1 hypothetical protein KC340_g5669 [Hortaea werneckii]KAI7377102.1 hypothetical protein KC328_g14591 [Hortaea werneckii]